MISNPTNDLKLHPWRAHSNKLLKTISLIGAILATLQLVEWQRNLPQAHCLQAHHQHHPQRPAAAPASLCHTTSGWFNFGHKCYKINYTPRNLEIAKNRCRELSAELAHVEDEPVPSRDEEMAPAGQQNASLVSLLTGYIKADFQNRLFYVNISADLFRQYRLAQQHETNGGGVRANGPDLSEHIESDFSTSDLWIPRDDSSFAAVRFNHTDSLADSVPGFALGRSSHYDKWGLVPISPTRKALSICEMPVAGHEHQARHQARAHSISGQPAEHSNDEPAASRRPLELPAPPAQATGGGAGGVGGGGGGASQQQANTVPDSRRSSEKDSGAGPSEGAAEGPPSALFRDLPQNQSVVMGSSSEMRCSPIEHDSTLHWTFNGKNLTLTNRIKLQASGTLRIDHVRNSDGGIYTCTIHSGGIVESRSARLEILERPHQPEYITAELLDKLSTSVRIKWTPGFNGNSPITKYLVEMKTVSGDSVDSSELAGSMQSGQWEVARANISADQTSVIIADLKPARKYVFRIKADNRIGTSDPSLPSRPAIEVPVQPPGMAPENLSGTARSSTSISIQWSPPPADSQNGLIKGYKIRHKLAGYASDTEWYTSELPEAAHLNFVLDDLITWQNYEIQVAAENDKGVGPYSASIQVRTKEGRPDKGPRNVVAESVSSSVLKVTWNPPPPQHINGINQGYKVQVWQDAAQSQLAREVVVPHNSLTPLQATTVERLQPYTDYYVSVRCFTSAGDGAPNEEPVVQRTMQDLPEPVPALEFHEVLDKSLRVVWRPPVRANGELDHYTLEYMESLSNDKKITTKRYPASMNEARINDLTPQTAYMFVIYPHNSVGKGAGRTNSTKTSVPPVLPEPPANLVPVSIGPYSATIQFEPGFNGNAAIEKWIAEALVGANGDYRSRWQNVYISTNHSQQANTVVVRNLRPYTRYRIRLTPVNVVGPSRYASEATAEFQTSQIEPEHAPRDLSLEEVRPTSAIARWSPLSNNNWSGLPLGYNLTWTESNNLTVNYQMINDTRADSYFVRDLEEFTEYVFKIYAVNGAGSSAASEPVAVTTLEDVPSSGPTNLTAHALSSTTVSVDWNTIPRRHRNGIIRGYKIQYQSSKANAPLQYKSVEENSTKHVTLTDLKPFTLYHLAVAAFTSVGDGVYGPIISVQTLEDTPGLPQNLSSPSVSQNTARILWDPPEDSNGDILGYKVSYYALSDSTNANGNGNNVNGKDVVASHELHHNERTFKATNLKADTHYVFTVTAKTKEGWGQQANTLIYTHDSELRANLPFFREGWFVILCACLSVVITIIVTALLFIQTKSYRYKRDVVKSTSHDRLGDAGFTIDEDPGSHYNNGFGLLSNGAHHRRSNGAISQSTANFTLPKTPPRPHPGSAVYSDDDDDDAGGGPGAGGGEDDDVFEDIIDKPVRSIAGTSHYDEDSSVDSLTEKPSEISSSPAPESESADDEYANMANRNFTNHYANVNGTLRSQRSWKKTNGSTSKQYASHRTKPKLPQRPAPSVPKVPGDHSQSSSDNASSQPKAGTSGAQLQTLHSRSTKIYGDLQNTGHSQPEPNIRTLNPSQLSSQQMNGSHAMDSNNTNPKMEMQQQNTQNQQQVDLLNNNHIVSLNGGRIIVDNMAGSRAPLPGFTSFV